MEAEFKELINEFLKINKRGYIKGINNNEINSGGLTFEKLINKQPDSLFFPDYNGIEIKTTGRFSRYNINLFSLSFDGPELFESNYLLERYGENDREFTEYKKLFVSLKINEKVLVNGKYYFELKINYTEKRICIYIYDIKYNLLEKRGFVSFDNLKERIEIKLNKLAIIYNSKKKMDNMLFFRYYKIQCYKYKNFDTFLKLIESSDIKINLILRFDRTRMIGKNKNKSLCFTLRKNSIDKLFKEVYKYEN